MNVIEVICVCVACSVAKSIFHCASVKCGDTNWAGVGNRAGLGSRVVYTSGLKSGRMFSNSANS